MILVFGACKSKQVATQVEVPVNKEADLPAWVRSRPVTDTYYIGIGQCPKGRADYLETAKKNALNDLASEISVTVEGNSLLYTLDRKQSFDEQYTSTIKTRTNEQ
ncbi:MAG: LPP20 family lipoprotein, partial [Flavobacteriales bacterium]